MCKGLFCSARESQREEVQERKGCALQGHRSIPQMRPRNGFRLWIVSVLPALVTNVRCEYSDAPVCCGSTRRAGAIREPYELRLHRESSGGAGRAGAPRGELGA